MNNIKIEIIQGDYVKLSNSPCFKGDDTPVYSKDQLSKLWFRVESIKSEDRIGITFNNLNDWGVSTDSIVGKVSLEDAKKLGVNY